MPKPCTHSYFGPAFPATPSAIRGLNRAASPEIITGTFRVVWEREGEVLLGNAEPREQFWVVRVPEVVGLREVAA
jgi:hypothetical protein